MSIFSQIVNSAVKDWDAIEKSIEEDATKVIQAVPSLEPEINTLSADVKQGASDLLGAAGTLLGSAAVPLTNGIETAADAALAAVFGSEAKVLDTFANNGINFIVTMATNALQAWALSAKAKLSGVAS